MAAFEVIALDTATPQLRAPGAADTYTFPRAVAFSGAITYGGVTLSNSVTGTGNMVLSASPTFTGTTTLATVSPETLNASSVGYTGMPQNSQSAAYGILAADAGKSIVHPISDNNARTFTIPANGSVAFPVGTTITFINMINTVTIAITTDTMYLAGTGTTGSRTLAAYGVATAIKVTSTSWIISGNGLT
jgi:autotransporter-associated beta strand protein